MARIYIHCILFLDSTITEIKITSEMEVAPRYTLLRLLALLALLTLLTLCLLLKFLSKSKLSAKVLRAFAQLLPP